MLESSLSSPTTVSDTAEFPEQSPVNARMTIIIGKLVDKPNRIVVIPTANTPQKRTGRLPILSI